jgi:hypothetical protein
LPVRNGLNMTFGEEVPKVGQAIRIKWGEGDWIDYGTVSFINAVEQMDPNESWLLSSDRYVNSVVRYYDLWEIKT